MAENARILERFMQRVWNNGEVAAVDDFLAERYTIHSDPGDEWDGKELTRDAFKARLVASRAPFPDLHFELGDIVSDEDRVAVSWVMSGTNTKPLSGRPPSGRTINVRGMTIYYFTGGRITGHRQVVDRLTIAQQLGMLG